MSIRSQSYPATSRHPSYGFETDAQPIPVDGATNWDHLSPNQFP
jgi:hypothetical protein